jgi:hypothetical protein
MGCTGTLLPDPWMPADVTVDAADEAARANALAIARESAPARVARLRVLI